MTTARGLLEATRYAAVHGFQPCTHAIGDKANRTMLDIYEKVQGESPTPRRTSNAHRARADPRRADIPRFGKLGVIASMEGIHCTSDRPWAESRLGDARVTEGLYVWQKLLKSGAHASSTAPTRRSRTSTRSAATTPRSPA